MPVRFHRSGVAFDPIYVLNGTTPHIITHNQKWQRKPQVKFVLLFFASSFGVSKLWTLSTSVLHHCPLLFSLVWTYGQCHVQCWTMSVWRFNVEGSFEMDWLQLYNTHVLNALCVDLVPISFFHTWAHGEDTSNIWGEDIMLTAMVCCFLMFNVQCGHITYCFLKWFKILSFIAFNIWEHPLCNWYF